MGLIFADDPAFVIPLHEKLRDLVEVQLACAHLRPWFSAVAREVLVVDVVDEVLPLGERGDDVHATAYDMTHIRCPAGDFGVQAAQHHIVVLLRAHQGGGGRVRMVGALDAQLSGALGNCIDVLRDIQAALLQVLVAATGQRHGAEHRTGEVLQEINGKFCSLTLIRCLSLAIPGTDQSQSSQLHVVLLEGVLQLHRVTEVAQPVFAAPKGALGDLEHHGLDTGETSLRSHTDHVVEFIVVTLARTLHEPGVHLGTELDFAHGRVCCWWWFGGEKKASSGGSAPIGDDTGRHVQQRSCPLSTTETMPSGRMLKTPDFIFATCRAGSEALLKREVASRHGSWLTPAFMRPQLITWKSRTPLRHDFVLDAAFATITGFSAGMARTAAEVAEKAPVQPCSVHVFPRVVEEDGVPACEWQRMDEAHAAIMTQLKLDPASPWVLDVILGADAEPWFLGLHRRDSGSHPHPGGLPRLNLDAEAPSRAWLKMEQSLAWLGLDAPGKLEKKTALELGSAPGGASWALLNRGMKVIGVDTAAMDTRVLEHPHFQHLRLPAGDLPRSALPTEIDLLASDMNLHPGLVLRYLERLTALTQPRWLILTLKMNDAEVESQIPTLLQQLRRFAPGEVFARQLHANRREITVISH